MITCLVSAPKQEETPPTNYKSADSHGAACLGTGSGTLAFGL